jgi:serine/threonine protein phosphatase PrpC
VILATDGLPDNLHTEEIVELIRKGPIERLPKALADLARHRMKNPGNDHPSKPDDLTFIVFRPGAKG